MKFSLSNRFFFGFQWYFIFLLIIDLLEPTSSAAVPSSKVISLYTANDKVTILTAQNFSSTVYNSKTAWLVEFYASWCGHCQSYANTYREVAIDTIGWKTVVRIGAINCYADDNYDVCEKHNIMAFPTLRLIPPETSFNITQPRSLIATNSKDVERELIKELGIIHRSDKAWPNFEPVNRISLDDLYQRISPTVKLILVIIEKQDDYTGRQIMLDFSKYYEQLAIFRATTDGTFWQLFQINATDIPALFVVFPNRTTEQIDIKQQSSGIIGSRNLFNYAIRSYIHRRKSIDNFDDRDLEEIIASRNALKEAEENKNTNHTIPKAHSNTDSKKVNMLDMETALSYMLRREIPRIRQIQGETYDALIHWLTILVKYFPGREPVKNYLKDLLSKVNEHQNGLTGKQFREFADVNTATSYLPNNQIRYEFCVGSSAQFRGYPCALWLLFHTLTVAQVETEMSQRNIVEIPSAIKSFIKHFFGCRHCSENFMKETDDMHQLDSNDKNAAMIYLWKIHNHVNQRLHGDETEDPEHPKVQFPSENLCSNCRSTNKDDPQSSFELNQIIEFLHRYYSKENLDFSSVETLATSEQKKLNFENEKFSMIELNDDSTSIFGLFVTMIQKIPFYFLVFLLVVLLIFIRRKYWKGKRKRYTM